MLTTNVTGSVTAIAGLIVSLVGYFWPGISISTDQIVAVIGAIITIVGVAKQWYDHTQVVASANAAIASARNSQ